MATLKHINSKNADYGAAEQYLLFEHDEFTMKPVMLKKQVDVYKRQRLDREQPGEQRYKNHAYHGYTSTSHELLHAL